LKARLRHLANQDADRRGCRCPERVRGFTLLETLVALAIIAISLAAVTKLAYQLTADTSAVFDRTLALLVAENQLTRLELGLGGDQGASSGEQTQLNASWRYRVQRTSTPDPAIERVTVTVSLAEDDHPLLSLSTYLAKPSDGGDG